MPGYHQAREEFGARLRQLRRERGITGKELAGRLGWEQSKVSRIETGKQTASEADVAAWIETVGVSSELANSLLASAQAVRTAYSTWRRQLRSGTQAMQQEVLDLESQSRAIRNFQSSLIPGLLQTPEYARHMLGQTPELIGYPKDVAEGVKVRMQRQEVLYDAAKRLHFVMTEAAMRYLVCPIPAMRAQIDRLIALSTLENVQLGVLPFEVPLPLTPSHGFVVFDEELVTVETLTGELILREPEEIRLYREMFDRLEAAASYGEAARAILIRVLDDLKRISD